ncbi:MAG: hypothetical protein M0Z99_34145 [Betaproteobacteria bacterium]|nr:hypothetical protein [Betaproteobacteria bacterium]
MPTDYFLGQNQEDHGNFDVALHLLDGVGARRGMGLHDHPFLGRQRTGLEQGEGCPSPVSLSGAGMVSRLMVR